MGDLDEFADEGEARLAPGTRLGKYAIIRLLGAGGMGAVYEALHTEIGKHVAIKVLGPAVAAIPGARARFLREAQITSRVRHPNIVDVTDMGNEAGQTYLVMELLPGQDLAQRLRFGPMSERELADVMLPVCAAVWAAHQAGITHRDLKPQNIFLATHQNGVQPKVLDFGISKGNDLLGAGTLTGTGAMIGTPFYLAPEQIMDNRSAGPASDQYSLGVILYECLTGSRPFDAENLFVVFQAIVAGAPMRLRDRRPDLSPEFEEVVTRAMHLNPKMRFETTSELGRALLPFASERGQLLWEEVFQPLQIDTKPFPPLADGTPSPRIAATTPLPPNMGMTTPIPSNPALTTPLPPASFPPPGPGNWLSAFPPKPPSSSVSGTRVMRPDSASISRPHLTPVDLADLTDPTPNLRATKSRKGVSAIAGILAVGGLATAGWLMSNKTNPDDGHGGNGSDPRSDIATNGPQLGDTPLGSGPKVVAPQPESFRLSVTTDPDNATVELDGTVVGSGSVERKMLVDHAPHTLRVSADGFEPRTVEFTDAPPPRQIALVRRIAAPPTEVDATAKPEETASDSSPTSASSSRRVRKNAIPRDSKPAKVRMPTSADSDSPRALNPNGAPIID